jgi:hypothetical protein
MACHTTREKVLPLKTGLIQTGSVLHKFQCTWEVEYLNKAMQIPVAARTKAWVCGRSLAGIAGSNPVGSTYVCPHSTSKQAPLTSFYNIFI